MKLFAHNILAHRHMWRPHNCHMTSLTR